ncbi:MAG: arylsulfatase [Planctomycetes bacterium]|nr:arylsulfatase [Planctomycetota bacterium]
MPLLPRFAAWCVLLITFMVVNMATWAEENRPPNIVLIVADDLGYGELGCYGQKIIRTPNIDRIAEEGIQFTQFYSGSPVCAPSRCMLMTGKHPGHAVVRNNFSAKHLQHMREKFGWEFPGQFPLPSEEVTLAELMKSRGYATAAIGKWGLGHVGTTGDPNQQGIDLFYGFNAQRHAHNHYPKFLWRNQVKEPLPGNDRTLHGKTYSQDKFTEVALQFVRENKDRPFFLYLPFAIPHLGIQVPPESLAWYKDKIPEEEYKHRGYIQHPYPRAGYAAMVTHMDRDIGMIMKLVQDLGLDDNTIIMFTSDNGPAYNRLAGSDSVFFNSTGPLRGRKGSVYEGGIRVPLVARWPKQIAAGSKSDHQAAFWDLLPTLCEVVDTAPPSEIDGISFAPTLLAQGNQQDHDYLYWEFPAYGGQQAIRVGDWKAVRQKIFKGRMQIELYNLATDIAEQHDVAVEHPERVAEMKKLMAEAHVPSQHFPLFDSEKKKKPKKPKRKQG